MPILEVWLVIATITAPVEGNWFEMTQTSPRHYKTQEMCERALPMERHSFMMWMMQSDKIPPQIKAPSVGPAPGPVVELKLECRREVAGVDT